MKVLLLLGLIYLTMAVHGKMMNKWEFAKKAKKEGLAGYHGVSLETWVCTAEAESGFNTKATNYNPGDRSTDYGPFQLNSHYWCNDNKTPNAKNACNVKCSELLEDNISKSGKCTKKVVKEQGMKAWYVFNK
ncbi:lysozyme C-like [Macrotis lagotis]|uniref:lysozyme C-like n=1 Tax=Macrotis lagotis TaxID=92651 RepID=UPI003D68E636